MCNLGLIRYVSHVSNFSALSGLSIASSCS